MTKKIFKWNRSNIQQKNFIDIFLPKAKQSDYEVVHKDTMNVDISVYLNN